MIKDNKTKDNETKDNKTKDNKTKDNKMKTTMTRDAKKLNVSIEGSIDTITAPELEKELKANWDGVTELILDFTAVDYISSAGLRVIMTTDQHLEDIGSLTIKNANDDVKEIFEMTGFDELLNFE